MTFLFIYRDGCPPSSRQVPVRNTKTHPRTAAGLATPRSTGSNAASSAHLSATVASAARWTSHTFTQIRNNQNWSPMPSDHNDTIVGHTSPDYGGPDLANISLETTKTQLWTVRAPAPVVPPLGVPQLVVGWTLYGRVAGSNPVPALNAGAGSLAFATFNYLSYLTTYVRRGLHTIGTHLSRLSDTT